MCLSFEWANGAPERAQLGKANPCGGQAHPDAYGRGAGKALRRLLPSPSAGEYFPALGRGQGWGQQAAR